MNETDIRKYAALMKELELTGLEITEEGRVVRLERCSALPVRETVSTAEAAPAAPASAADGTKVLSPRPGNILAVNVSVGAAVKAGDVLLVLEAMKMENDIVAPCDGTVKQILVQKGSTVATDDLLAVVG